MNYILFEISNKLTTYTYVTVIATGIVFENFDQKSALTCTATARYIRQFVEVFGFRLALSLVSSLKIFTLVSYSCDGKSSRHFLIFCAFSILRCQYRTGQTDRRTDGRTDGQDS